MATTYAVVRYKNNLAKATYFDMTVYSKTSSNLDKMTAYRDEIAAKYPRAIVALVKRETAEKMHKTWYNHFQYNIGKTLSRQDKKRSQTR